MSRLALLLPLLWPLGCAHTPEARHEASPAKSTDQPKLQGSATAEVSPKDLSCARDLDCGSRQLCIRSHCVEITAGLAECSQVRVYFPLNSALLESGTALDLERSARCLKADQALHVTIEGNADERGTEEYNLALGDERAMIVAKRLEALGVSQTQLKTVSYGKENPLCTEHDEACWSKNRRAEVNLTGAKELRRRGQTN